jgi:chemotaxis protein methyltransferase CheR
MTESEFAWLCAFLRRRSGLALSAQKRYLAEGRLGAVCRRHALPDLCTLVHRLMAGDRRLETATVAAMMTNETLFFRDSYPFASIRDLVLPTLQSARRAERVLRIWCAAASSGQEPYSIAMLIDEVRPILPGWRFEILATDICDDMVERGRTGLYSQFEVQRGLPTRLLLKHFTRDGERWRLSERIRQLVTFRTHNLLEPCQHLGQFDLILCRNILIYLDRPTRGTVLDALHRQMRPDGFLMLGATETAQGVSDLFEADPNRRGLHRSSIAGARAVRGETVMRPAALSSAPLRARPSVPDSAPRPPLRLVTRTTANG